MTMRGLVDRFRRGADALAVRTILVLLLSVGAVHLLSLWTYRHALDRQAELAGDERLADQLLTIKRAVMREPADRREAVAHDLSGGPLEAHWSRVEHAIAGGPGSEQLQDLAGRLAKAAPELAADGLILGANRRAADDPHLAVVSMRLPDDSWVNVSILHSRMPAAEGHGTLLSTTLMALGALAVAILLVRWLTRPLTSVAAAAMRFSGTGAPVVVPEEGPREVRELASAFNDMQRRIAQLLADRTQALAAVSHDLKTPITRLRFRAEAIADARERQAVIDDLVDMERMIDQTLAYLRGDPSDEEIKPVDLVAILETISDDMADAGADVSLEGSSAAVLPGRRLSLKRAFGNLVENAVKYGGRARIRVSDGAPIEVRISDDGPGIPPGDAERAFESFVRLEGSRNRETGGFGLGLTIARRIIDGHGGTIALENRPGGGLDVVVRLPVAAPQAG